MQYFHVFMLELANYGSMIKIKIKEGKNMIKARNITSLCDSKPVRDLSSKLCVNKTVHGILSNCKFLRGQKSLRVANENEYDYDWYCQNQSRTFPTTATTITVNSRMLFLLVSFRIFV